MKNYFIMYRRGEFHPSVMTNNQCGVKGVDKYFYSLKMLFDGDLQLDKDDFIVDHQMIDDIICSMKLSGSCEDMQRNIVAAIEPFLADEKELPLLGVRCELHAGDKDSPGWMEYVSLKEPRYAAMLGLT